MKLTYAYFISLVCSANHIQKSAPLRKEKTLLEQRLVPLDPLDDVPKPKGFPDGPPPRPRDDIFGVGKLFLKWRREYSKIYQLI